MEPPGGRDSRFNLGYSMNLLSGETPPEIYGNPNLGRPSTSLQQLSPRHTMVSSACGTQSLKGRGDVCYGDERAGNMTAQGLGLDTCGGVNDVSDDAYNSLQVKKSPPSNGKKTKGRVKIKMEYIENKLRRYTTFSKRKTGIMKKAYELSTLTGTQVMLLVASETGHVYTFATRKLQPMITSEAGKALIQTCLNSPDPPVGSSGGDQRMSATGFEETELTYNISDDDSKEENNLSQEESSGESSEDDLTDASAMQRNAYPPIPTPPPLKSPSSPHKQAESKPSTLAATIKVSPSPPLSANNNATFSNVVYHPTSASTSHTSPSPPASSSSSATATTPTSQPPVLTAPLLYQTPQGVMYATSSNGGVIFSLAPTTDANSTQTPQFITIPLSMMATTAHNGQGELDLSNKKK